MTADKLILLDTRHKTRGNLNLEIETDLQTLFVDERDYGVSENVQKIVDNRLVFTDSTRGAFLFQGNCLEVMDKIAEKYPKGCFDMIFADPPYFLSNGGISCHAGKMVKVDKGDWGKSQGPELNHEFNYEWLKRAQKLLKPNGTIFVSGTMHVIFSIGYAMQQLGMKILNDITWEKPNPPPNLSCRYFTHSTETILWAAKNEKSKHHFNYDLMREYNDGKQMKSVWRFTAPGNAEKNQWQTPNPKTTGIVRTLHRSGNQRRRFCL